jgi:hypothetical protein
LGGSWFKADLIKKVAYIKVSSTNKLGMVVQVWNSSYTGDPDGAQACAKSMRPYLKISKVKRVQGVECMPSKCEALNSKTQYCNK